MQRLDEVVGALNWKREHSRDNANCIVSIWDGEKNQWVSKEDTGTESNTERAKGLASDSFKRACFNWGIGRELYDYPFIYINLNSNEVYKNKQGKDATSIRPNDWIWHSQFTDGKLSFLAAKDQSGLRYSWGKFNKDLENE